MWNPFKLRSTEARRLEIRLVELEDDVGKLVRLIERIDARQRGRASKQSQAADADAGGDVASSANGGQHGPPQSTDVGRGETPVFSKDQLRAFARARGFNA